MNCCKTSRKTRACSTLTRRHLGDENEPGSPDACQRISSLRPHVLVFLVVLGAVVAFSLVLNRMISSGQIPWALLFLAAAHTMVALAGCLAWKRVRRSNGYYVMSDLFRSEAVSFDDVCMVVEEQGFIWNGVCIHFKRRTRFGWSVSYVPTRSTSCLDWLVSAFRPRRSSDAQLPQKS